MIALWASIASADATDPVPSAGYRPDPRSSEAGLWMLSDKLEQFVQTSPLLVRDSSLNGYVRGLVCKLSGPDCGDLRVYVLEDPTMNAETLPNGAVVVFTGLLLRMQNEAQLAFVLGHEMTHYYNRHSVKRWESERGTMNVLAFLGGAALPLYFIAMDHFMSFSRDQEREADEGGFQRATAMGYEPQQAAEIWRMMAEEDKADPNKPSPGIFGRDHPSDEERLAALSKRAAEIESTKSQWTTGADDYRKLIAPFRDKWLEDEIARSNGWQSAVVLERMVRNEPNNGMLQYFLGEAYRKRGKDGDAQLAVAAYQQAVASEDPPPRAWRDLGLLAMKSGRTAEARTDFASYLARAPNADDRSMIEFYQSQLGGK